MWDKKREEQMKKIWIATRTTALSIILVVRVVPAAAVEKQRLVNLHGVMREYIRGFIRRDCAEFMRFGAILHTPSGGLMSRIPCVSREASANLPRRLTRPRTGMPAANLDHKWWSNSRSYSVFEMLLDHNELRAGRIISCRMRINKI